MHQVRDDVAVRVGVVGRLVVAVSVAMGGSGCRHEPTSTANGGRGELIAVELSTGSFAPESETLAARISGPEEPGSALLVAASCHNAVDWDAGRALDNGIVVGANPRLVRVAELLADDQVSADLALIVESKFLRGVDVELDAMLSEVGFDQADVDGYLALVAQAPSQEALDRFVVYAVSVTTTVVRVVYLDSSSMPPPETFKRLAGQDLYLSLSDGLQESRVSREQCDALRESS